jgi:hypothetical protein
LFLRGYRYHRSIAVAPLLAALSFLSLRAHA